MSSATTNSLRKTISAVDMSKIYDQDVERKNNFVQQQPGQLDIWCSILTQNSSSLPPPYVHPLVKQSKSCLSLKSLEICTENLGSESGSDGYPHSDISLSDTEEEDKEEAAIEQIVEERSEVVKFDKNELVAVNYSKKYSSPSSGAPRSFPPQLKSLSKPGGAGMQMRTHRKDGRLVLEAVSVPTSQNCFNAQRQDGRLVLTFTPTIPESKSLEDVFETDEEVEFNFSPDNEIEEPTKEEEEYKGLVLEMTSTRVPKLPTGVMKVHRSALMVNKFTGLTNNRNNRSSSSNLKNKLEKMTNSPSTKLLPQSLSISPPTLAAGAPPPPRRSSKFIRYTLPQQTVGVTAATVEDFSPNRYEYFWRKNTSSMVSVGGIHHSLNQQSLPNNKNPYHHNNNNSNNFIRSKNDYYTNSNSNNFSFKDSATTTKGGNYYDYKEEKQNGNGEKIVDQHLIVPAYCKPEHIRRSSVFLEPHCIATS
ncbi:hypothetical protein MKX03_027180 [Papaver bracteatum]|nr:hypothetical protein MKX03_027180 [Papaver bracteatum]